MIAVIPAYQPDEKLLATVAELQEKTDFTIIVVNDGSSEACAPVFSQLPQDVTLLVHEVNRGKGAALKTAYTYIYEHCSHDEGIVTLDADGQHLVKDIIAVCNEWKEHPDALVLGSRKFTGNVPWRSMAGNTITRLVFQASTGARVYDTQTGLRAFAVSLVPTMLTMKGDRYEYEINQLLFSTRYRIPIREVWIETVYLEENKSSHFHALRDGWKIYKMILLFAASSIIAAVIDYVLVLAFVPLLRYFSVGQGLLFGVEQALLFGTLGARVISSLCNYFINREVVFENKSWSSMLRYYVVVVIIYFLNLGILNLLNVQLPLPLWVAKLIAELVCYPLSFYLQRKFVFVEKPVARQ